MLFAALPDVAWMVAVPADVEAVRTTWAVPPMVVTKTDELPQNVPRLVLNVTIVPSGTGFPFWSNTWAVMTDVELPSASSVPGETVS